MVFPQFERVWLGLRAAFSTLEAQRDLAGSELWQPERRPSCRSPLRRALPLRDV